MCLAFGKARDQMDFLQQMPEAGQLVLMGSGLLFVGVLFRKLRKALSVLREPVPSTQQSETQ
jgi:hypothetical protein